MRLWRHPKGGKSSSFTLRYALRNIFGTTWHELHFEPRDLWIGVHWKRPDVSWRFAIDIYVCVIPMLPYKFMWRHGGWRSVDENFRCWWHGR